MDRSDYFSYRRDLEACFSFAECCEVMVRAAKDPDLSLMDYCDLLCFHESRLRVMKRMIRGCEEVTA